MKKRIQFFLFLPLLFLCSCSSKPVVVPPADLIREDTIVQMVAEQLIIESLVFNAPMEYNKEKLTRAQYSQLFEKYNVSVPRYQSSLKYYFSDKEKMEDIMKRAKDLIEEKKSQLPTQ